MPSVAGSLVLAVVWLVTLTTARPPQLAAQGTEIVRGKVVDTQKQPLAGVEVTITGQASGVIQTTTTNAKGMYVATFRDPQGSYSLSFRKLGYGSYIRSAKQSGLSSIIDVPDAELPGGLNVLQPITANASRLLRVPARNETPSVGGLEMSLQNNGLFLIDPSDLIRLATQLPGVQNIGDSSFSVLGAPPDQNKVVVDGADFAGATLPRDAIASSKLVTASFDPSKGQFAGAETIVSTRHGNDYFQGMLRGEIGDPHLAWTDPASPSPVPQLGGSSGFLGGPIVPKKFWYFGSFDLSNRTTAAPSLLSPRSALLDQLGVSSDSIAFAATALRSLGAPLTESSIPNHPASLRASAMFNFDYRVNPVTSFTLSATGNWNRATGNGISELAFPGTSSQGHATTMVYLLSGGTYFHRILEDFHFSVTSVNSNQAPYLLLASGSVLVGTALPDNRAGLTSFRFGGGSGAASASSGNAWEADNTIAWATPNIRHQFKFTQYLRHESGISQQLSSPFGSYTYQTLADLAANKPSSFNRALSSTSRSYDATISALSLGDVWHVVPGKLDVAPGVRYDSRTFGTAPQINQSIDLLFGVRTNRVPVDQAFSPRLGFSWTPKARRGVGLPDGMTIISTAGGGGGRGTRSPLEAAGLSGLLVPGSDVTIAGGVGAFRGVIASPRVGALTDQTGLPSTTRYLSCVGPATPIPDWTLVDGVPPASCADGTTSQQYSATQPRVAVFAPSFGAPVSWRGELQVKGWHIHDWAVAPEVTYSVGINTESWVDLNLQHKPQFTLSSEANRQIFASPGEIDPTTGLFAPTAGRVSSAYGRVTETLADLRYHTAQLILPIAPPKPLFGKVPLFFVYALDLERMQQRGFSGTTAGDPFAVEWVDGRQSRHQFTLGAGNIRVWWFTMTTRFDLFSGTSYTPMVSQDINGDGVANDRAFIVPATSGDVELAGQMSKLLASSSQAVRTCLESQSGTIAKGNSCRTPWQGRLDLSVAFTPPQTFGLSSRLRMTTTMLNAGGAVARLLGLENTPLGQSPSSLAVDQRLLYVTGFDPGTQQFRYTVNQLFGKPVDYGSAHHLPPFQVKVGLEYRIGYPSPAQTAKNYGILPTGKDTTGQEERVKSQLVRLMGGKNPAPVILALRDSLALTAEQVAGIEAVNRQYAAWVDSTIAPAVAFAIQRGGKLTSDELNAAMKGKGTAERDVNRVARQKAVAYLLPEQRTRLEKLTHQSWP